MKVVVNGQSSDIYLLNAGVPQGSVLGPTLFLLFINDLPDDVLASFIDMFADDTTEYGVTSKSYHHADLAADLTSDLSIIVQWGQMWLVTFNATKTKLITFHHHRNNPDFTEITMDGTYLHEPSCLNKLLCLKFTPELKWNSSIDSVAKYAARMVGALYRSMRLLTPESLLYLYKSQIRLRM